MCGYKAMDGLTFIVIAALTGARCCSLITCAAAVKRHCVLKVDIQFALHIYAAE